MICLQMILVIESEKDHRVTQLISSILSKVNNKTIIFAETKKKVDYLTSRLRRDGYAMF